METNSEKPLKIFTAQTEPLVAPSSVPSGWLDLIKDGSYAIIIFIVIVFFLARQSLKEFLSAHMAMMASLRASNDKNTAAIEDVVTSVKRLTRNNTVLTKLIAKSNDPEVFRGLIEEDDDV